MLLDASGLIEDHWPRLGDEAPLPEQGYVLVPLDRLDEAFAAECLHVGVEIANDVDPTRITAHSQRIGLVSILFPSFADGRGFSVARRLRDLGFVGRLRASGPVIADQFAYLMACGFDEVRLPDSVAQRQPVAHWLAQHDRVSLAYQRGRSGKISILDQRRAAR